MNGVKSLTANFNVAYTLTTVPEGLTVVVNGVTHTTPKVLGWAPGSSHTIGVASPQTKVGEAGTRYVYQSWSDGKTQNHTVTMPQTPGTYTATFGKQYSLTTASNPSAGGSVTPAGVSWWNADATTTGVKATASSGYQFTDWTGASVMPMVGAVPGVAIVTLEMNAPKALTAEFTKLLGYTVTSVPVGRQVVVDGVTYTTPKVFNWLPGTDHRISATSPQLVGTGTRYVYQSWSDAGDQSHTVTTPATAKTYTVTFGTQYALTASNAAGFVNPAGAGTLTLSPEAEAVEGGRSWYKLNQAVTATATPAKRGCVCGWTGVLTAGSGEEAGGTVGTVVMNSPKSVTANFNVAYTVTTVPEGLTV